MDKTYSSRSVDGPSLHAALAQLPYGKLSHRCLASLSPVKSDINHSFVENALPLVGKERVHRVTNGVRLFRLCVFVLER